MGRIEVQIRDEDPKYVPGTVNFSFHQDLLPCRVERECAVVACPPFPLEYDCSRILSVHLGHQHLAEDSAGFAV